MLKEMFMSKSNKETLYDVLTSVSLGLMLALGALAYFDVLVA